MFFEILNNIDQAIVQFASNYIPRPSSYFLYFAPSVTQEEIQTIEEMTAAGTFPAGVGLIPAIYYFLLLSGIRLFLQHTILQPFVIWVLELEFYDIKPSKSIDKLVKSNKKYSATELDPIASQLKISTLELKKEIRKRRINQVNNKKISKFIEAAWRFIFYSLFVFVGINVLIYPEPKIWVTDRHAFFTKWPFQGLDEGVAFYYLIELGAYLHQLCWTEVNRADTFEMMLHHCVTIILLLISYLSNFTRVGSAILLVHDAADIFLELAKCFNYIANADPIKNKWAQFLTDFLFVIFTITFFITR